MVSVPQVLVVEPLAQTPCRQDRFVKASASPQVGVRLVKFLDSCKIITNDNWALKIIQEGVQKLPADSGTRTTTIVVSMKNHLYHKSFKAYYFIAYVVEPVPSDQNRSGNLRHFLSSSQER